tara:strand:+ start:250 stop:432 length:183 start_codon:yes stop_codon:yes gene_type:complete
MTKKNIMECYKMANRCGYGGHYMILDKCILGVYTKDDVINSTIPENEKQGILQSLKNERK